MNPLPPAVVLVRPREEGNVGAAARAMANMGLSRLILVEPAAEIGGVARAFAVGARAILDTAVRCPGLHDALAPFRRVVGTTSTRDRRLAVPLLTPPELPAWLAQDPPDTPTALVFGPEVGGLTNDELALASAVVTIPCSPVQPTLNLAQSVLILAYELFLARGETSAAAGGEEPPATAAELDGLLEQAAGVLARIGFARDDSFPGVLRDLRRLAARAAPDSRDVRILRGICRRAEGALRATLGGEKGERDP
ncbi:MAG TPA: RNA methyltransferase [Thermoanaerobaculia bacterium]|jgi:TrmH family RNA methyltransferase|nr:RNA methyltransferase [Thermoanaerobaculia bacterium]